MDSEYYMIFQSIIARNRIVNLDGIYNDAIQTGSLTIAPCAGMPYFLIESEKTDPRISDIAYLALSFAYAKASLSAARVPPALWEEDLSNTEKKYLDHLRRKGLSEDTGIEELAERVDKKASAMKLGFQISGVAECSYDVRGFRVVIKPKADKVRLIPKIYYRFCEELGVDPLDRKKCKFWIDPVSNGEEKELGGAYYYVIETAGKLGKVKQVDVDEIDVGPDEYTSPAKLAFPRP